MNAKSITLKVWLLFSAIRLIPHILLIKYHPMREIIELDRERWSIEIWSYLQMSKKSGTRWGGIYTFIHLMTYHPEYRNLFYCRIGFIGKILSCLCRPMPMLYLRTKDIGPGLFIQHGYCTDIGGKVKIGRNCSINQMVSIGYTNDIDCPTIGNNVKIHAGAKVLGNVRVGDNSIVGANAVVVKNVPENCTVVGVPAYIVRRNGLKVKEPL